MNHRQRELAAIRHEIPDRIPVDAICIENAGEIGELLGVPPDAVVEQLGIDGRMVSAERYTGDLPTREGKILSHWGTEDGNDYGTTHFYPLAAADRPAEVEHYPWPDGGSFDFDEMGAALKNWPGVYALRGPYWISAPLFCTTCNLMGMEEALVKMAVEPAVFEACIEQIFRFSSAYLERFIAAAGEKLDILYLEDDFASQRGLMMSPGLWRKLLKPWYAKLFNLGKQNGLPVWFHSCGDITAILPDLIEIGMDVWETVQLQALPISAAKLKQEYGREITFFGGINTQALPFKTPAEVAEEVRRCIDILGEGGGYICGPDHHIKPDVPAANTVALFETAKGYARPGYTKNLMLP
jgi:uroporphyrinogen decarboxylase